MPEIYSYLGIRFDMYSFDNQQHKLPHVHAKYGSFELIIAIETGEFLAGYLPNKQAKTASNIIAENRAELMVIWEEAVNGRKINKLGKK